MALRQAAVAQAVGISPSYLNLIEHNRRPIGGKLLADLARALGVDPSSLAGGADRDLLDQLHNAATLGGDKAELARADVREPADMPTNVITMNSRARIREHPSGKERELTLVYPAKAEGDSSRISVFSPAGSALLGLSTGQSIDWPTVEGHVVHLEVLEVTNQPEADTEGDA